MKYNRVLSSGVFRGISRIKVDAGFPDWIKNTVVKKVWSPVYDIIVDDRLYREDKKSDEGISCVVKELSSAPNAVMQIENILEKLAVQAAQVYSKEGVYGKEIFAAEGALYLHADNEGLLAVQICFGDTSMFLKMTSDEFANVRGYKDIIAARVIDAYRNESKVAALLSSCDFGAELCSALVGHSVSTEGYGIGNDNIIIPLLSCLYEVYSSEVSDDNTGMIVIACSKDLSNDYKADYFQGIGPCPKYQNHYLPADKNGKASCFEPLYLSRYDYRHDEYSLVFYKIS